MRTKTITNFKIIHEHSAQSFENEINKWMQELSEQEPQITFSENSAHSFLARIEYKITERTIETVADEFHAEGLRYLCVHCPHLERDGDKRKKWQPCRYAEYGATRIDCEACELFYRQVKTGAIRPIEEDRDDI